MFAAKYGARLLHRVVTMRNYLAISSQNIVKIACCIYDTGASKSGYGFLPTLYSFAIPAQFPVIHMRGRCRAPYPFIRAIKVADHLSNSRARDWTVKTFSKRALLRAGAAPVILGASLIATTALAQDVPQGADAASNDTIVVTGSRIARPDLQSNSPISIVSADVIQSAGKANIEDVLNQLPQVQPGLNAASNNPGDGTATVDLRGLGANRTLVLVNGRRLVPATNDGRTDLNNIPAGLIERVDVVTGGASAVYGSDAIAGVVNFILKNDFEGVELNGQYNLSDRGDSATYNFGGIIGGNFADGRGNVTFAVDYYDRKGTFQSERPYTAIDANGGSGTGVAGGFDNSPTNPFGAYNGNPAGINYAFNPDGTPRRRINTLGVGGDRYNFAPVNYLQIPGTRLQLNMLSHYDVNDNITVFAEGMYTDSRAQIQLAPTPATNILVDPTSPALSQEARDLAATRVFDPTSALPTGPNAPLIFRRRMSDVGPRIQDFNYDVYQVTAGVRGDILDGWKYEVYYSYGRTENTTALTNDVSRARLVAGLNGCPVGSPDTCVPLTNAFGGVLSEAEANSIRIGSSVDTFVFSRQNVVATLGGTLVDLPAGPLAISIGAEYRKDSSNFQPSESSRTGDLGGFNAALPVKGSFNVKEFFGEISIPLLKDSAVGHYLGLEGGARYSDYSSVGRVFTWKAGGEYAPFESLRFRGLYQVATRAPSVFELFQSGDQDFPTIDDPCASTLPDGSAQTIPGSVATICGLPQQLPGVNLANYAQLNTQVEARNVGNANLDAEKSKTFTLGGVFTPTFVPGLSLSVDYFNIKITDYIDRIGGGAVALVDGCFASGVTTAAAYDANPFCSLVTRNASGELFITVPLVNNSTLKTNGFDFAANMPFRIGESSKLTLNANATLLKKYSINGTRYDKLTTGDRGTLPKWRTNVRATYAVNDLTFAVNWQRVGSVLDVDGTGEKIKAQDYFDLNGRIAIGDHLELFAGIQNLLDNKPPLITNGLGPNTDGSTYDVIGRRLFTGAKLRF